MAVSLTFWGTRGSIPTPGAPTSRYGGNTPCVSATVDQSLVVLDAGSGLRVLGRELVRHAPSGPLSIDLLLSHTHWDHIQGLPFFAPLFQRGTEVRIYGAQQNGTPIDVILQRQMDPTVFPVPLAALNARLTVTEITEEPLDVGAFMVQVVSLCHPGRTLGFALAPRAGGPMAAYLTDNELGAEAARAARPPLVRFLRGCDTLVHDAMYFESENATILRFIGRGTNDGPLGDFPATGRSVASPQCDIYEFDSEGRVAKAEIYYDQLSILQQLGHVAQAEPARV